MSILKPANNKNAYAKIGIYGSAGSGKSRTATEIAIGLHKRIKSTKPIAVFDTEPAFGWLLPIFNKNNIELLASDESRALVDLMQFLDEAEKSCDIVIIDSITHVWRDAQESFLSRINSTRKANGKKPIYALEFQHWKPIKSAWADFTDRFLSSKLHVIVCGRSGQVYEYQDKDDGTGKKELISSGTRMATDKELGYEPSLLIEMVLEHEENKVINVASIQKDRSDTINGKSFRMPTFDHFKSHFDFINLGGNHFDSMNKKNSESIYPEADESGFDVELKRRTILCEEIQELIKNHHPSQSVEDKQAKAALLEKFFETRSWTAVENMKADNLKQRFEALKKHFDAKESGVDVETGEVLEDVQQ